MTVARLLVKYFRSQASWVFFCLAWFSVMHGHMMHEAGYRRADQTIEQRGGMSIERRQRAAKEALELIARAKGDENGL